MWGSTYIEFRIYLLQLFLLDSKSTQFFLAVYVFGSFSHNVIFWNFFIIFVRFLHHSEVVEEYNRRWLGGMVLNWYRRVVLFWWLKFTELQSCSQVPFSIIELLQLRASKIRRVLHIFDWLIFHYSLLLIFRLTSLTSARSNKGQIFY